MYVCITPPPRCVYTPQKTHLEGNPGANLKSTSHRCYLLEVAFVWELTKETIVLPLGCLLGGYVYITPVPGRARAPCAMSRAGFDHCVQSLRSDCVKSLRSDCVKSLRSDCKVTSVILHGVVTPECQGGYHSTVQDGVVLLKETVQHFHI